MRRALVLAVLLAAAVALAALAPVPAAAGKPCAVPKSWGPLKAATFYNYGSVSGDNLIFEAEDGTIRIIGSGCGDRDKPTIITRTAD